MNDDIVAIVILPKHQWTCPSSVVAVDNANKEEDAEKDLEEVNMNLFFLFKVDHNMAQLHGSANHKHRIGTYRKFCAFGKHNLQVSSEFWLLPVHTPRY